MGWYPLVGLGLGAAAWGVYAGPLGSAARPRRGGRSSCCLLEAVTRGLHMDGLMDTCDGYFSGAPRERALEIMKDSRVGAMGVVGGGADHRCSRSRPWARWRAPTLPRPCSPAGRPRARCRRSTCMPGPTRAPPAPARRSRDERDARARWHWPARSSPRPSWSPPSSTVRLAGGGLVCGAGRRAAARWPAPCSPRPRWRSASAASPATSTAWASSWPRRSRWSSAAALVRLAR